MTENHTKSTFSFQEQNSAITYFDSRWCHTGDAAVATDGTMCPGVDSASKNEYQWFPLGVKAAGAWGWRPTTFVVPKVKKIRGLNLTGTPLGSCGLLWAWPWPSPLQYDVIFRAILGELQAAFHIVQFYSVLLFIMEYETDLKAERTCFRSVFNDRVFSVCESYAIPRHRVTRHLPCISFESVIDIWHPCTSSFKAT
jgi:hypothetical protein